MELENLKTALENRAASFRPGRNLMVPGTASVSILAKIERSLKWEIAIAFLFAAFCFSAVFLIDALAEKAFLTALFTYAILFTARLYAILKKSIKATNSARPVKDCVEETISVVTSFMKIYERLTTWFLPLVFIAAILAAGIAEYSRYGSSMQIPVFTIVVSMPLMIAWILLMRRFSTWWLSRLYGKYLHMLTSQLNELKEDDSNT